MKKNILIGLSLLFLSCNDEQIEIGSTATNSLINMTKEPSGTNCKSGGFKINIGIDTNRNNNLEVEEIKSTQYICNGNNGTGGLNSLTKVTNEGKGNNCSTGGYKIEVGIDYNKNNVLDINEVQTTQYICNGAYDKEVRFDFDWPFFGSLSTTSTSGAFNDIKTSLINFNINNYADIDSVAFGGYIKTSETSSKCIIELFNKTDNKVIANSQVTTNQTSQVFVSTTNNFLNSFPNKDIDLGIRVRTEKEGVYVQLAKPLLYLYRK